MTTPQPPRTLAVVGYLLLLLIGVPWYWGWLPELAGRLVVGMPVWGAVSLAASVLASAWTVWLLKRRWPDELGAVDEERA